MSRNRKYIEEFDRNAGSPADFDNLFRFSGKEIIANKKIRVRSSKKRAALMSVSAAAVITAAILGLSYFGEISKNVNISIEENAGGFDMDSETEMVEFEAGNYISDEPSQYHLSELVSRFDYYLTDTDISAAEDFLFSREWTAENYLNSDIIMMATVVKKELLEDGTLLYKLHPNECFYELDTDNNIDVVHIANAVTVDVAAPMMAQIYPSAYTELQAGSTYILPINITDITRYDLIEDIEYSLVLDDDAFFPIRYTEYGWLVSDTCGKLAEGAASVSVDIDGLDLPYKIGLVDDPMLTKVEEQLLEMGYNYSYIFNSGGNENGITGMLNSFFDFSNTGLEYESVNHYINEDGTYDKTILVLENETYFTLRPQIPGGKVVFTGENIFGEKTVAVYSDNGLADPKPELVVFTGLESILVSVGDEVYKNVYSEDSPYINEEGYEQYEVVGYSCSTIGTCTEEPIYCRFFDITGPVEVDVYDSGYDRQIEIE